MQAGVLGCCVQTENPEKIKALCVPGEKYNAPCDAEEEIPSWAVSSHCNEFIVLSLRADRQLPGPLASFESISLRLLKHQWNQLASSRWPYKQRRWFRKSESWPKRGGTRLLRSTVRRELKGIPNVKRVYPKDTEGYIHKNAPCRERVQGFGLDLPRC
jgi:hypothetical protein